MALSQGVAIRWSWRGIPFPQGTRKLTMKWGENVMHMELSRPKDGCKEHVLPSIMPHKDSSWKDRQGLIKWKGREQWGGIIGWAILVGIGSSKSKCRMTSHGNVIWYVEHVYVWCKALGIWGKACSLGDGLLKRKFRSSNILSAEDIDAVWKA